MAANAAKETCMPVIIEAITVVIRRKAIDEKYPGGYLAFDQEAPTMGPVDTLVADADIAAVAFMAPIDVKAYCDFLGKYGIGSPENPVDLAVIDQFTGAVTPCDWIETAGQEVEGGGPVLTARLVGSTDETLVVPEGWSWKNSITKNTFFMPNEALMDSVEYVRSEPNGLDVYRDKLTGELRYIGRPTDPLHAVAQRVQA
jgi:hypothetical protein